MKLKGNLVKHYRLNQGWSQEKMAEVLLLSDRTIQRIEHGCSVRPSTAALVADEMGVLLQTLRDDHEN